MGGLRLDVEIAAVDPQEDVRGEEGDALVAVEKWMVHQQRIEHRGGHCHQIVVVTAAWAIKCAFEEAKIAHAGRTAELRNHSFVDREYLIDG